MPNTPARRRATMRLASTHCTRAVDLDFDSNTGIEYARQWARKACGQMPPIAGVVRRAITVYLHGLGDPHMDPLSECAAIARACAPLRPDEDRQQGTLKRLQWAIEAEGIPTWPDVLRDPLQSAEMAAVEAHVVAAADLILACHPDSRRPPPTPANVGLSACAQAWPRVPPGSPP